MRGSGASNFPSTSWSLVVAAAANPTPDSRASLARICEAYWPPVYAFVRRTGYDKDQAQDLTQAFFATMLEKNYLGHADRERGRFRTFLLASVKHFLANELDKRHAWKRGGGLTAVPIDPIEAEEMYAPEAVEERTPETLFVHDWALTLLVQVMARLREEYAAMAKADSFAKLSPLLDGDSPAKRYGGMASELGVSPGALRVAVHRMRRRYRELLRAELALLVATPEEIDEEIAFLLAALRL
jgi:DNA-directed RNA polymerase specialized sigma24 family protein